MEKITLQPGVWRKMDVSSFQVIGQNPVRMSLGSGSTSAAVAPPAADAPYFLSQSYDPKIVTIANLLGFDRSHLFHMMPHGDQPVDVVVM